MSEVARLLRQIELEYEAAKRGLEEYAVISRHKFISARYEKVDGYQKQLMVLLGEEQATEVVCNLYDVVFDGKQGHMVEVAARVEAGSMVEAGNMVEASSTTTNGGDSVTLV